LSKPEEGYVEGVSKVGSFIRHELDKEAYMKQMEVERAEAKYKAEAEEYESFQRQKELELVNKTLEKYEQLEEAPDRPTVNPSSYPTTHLAEDPHFREHHLKQENAEFKAHTLYLKDELFNLSNSYNHLERKYQALAVFVKEIL
jgi:hypothetical protein